MDTNNNTPVEIPPSNEIDEKVERSQQLNSTMNANDGDEEPQILKESESTSQDNSLDDIILRDENASIEPGHVHQLDDTNTTSPTMDATDTDLSDVNDNQPLDQEESSQGKDSIVQDKCVEEDGVPLVEDLINDIRANNDDEIQEVENKPMTIESELPTVDNESIDETTKPQSSPENSDLLKGHNDTERITPTIENLSSNGSFQEESRFELKTFQSIEDTLPSKAQDIAMGNNVMKEEPSKINSYPTRNLRDNYTPKTSPQVEEEKKQEMVYRVVGEETGDTMNNSTASQGVSSPLHPPSHPPSRLPSQPSLYAPGNYASFNGANSMDFNNIMLQSQQQFQPALSHHLHHTPMQQPQPPRPPMHEQPQMGYFSHQSAFSQPQIPNGSIMNGNHHKYTPQQQIQHYQSAPPPPPSSLPSNRRTIKLHLVEERKLSTSTTINTFFRLPKLKKSNNRTANHRSTTPTLGGKTSSDREFNDEVHSHEDSDNTGLMIVDRSDVYVSWYEGTSTSELQEHVRKSVKRKLNLDGKKTIHDVRIIDISVDPHEEIVLSPYIPDGSSFLLKFSIDRKFPLSYQSSLPRAPDSPSAAPSPSRDLDMLHQQINEVLSSGSKPNGQKRRTVSDGQMNFKSDDSEKKEVNNNVNVSEKKEDSDESVKKEVSDDNLQKLNETLQRIDAWERGEMYRPVEKKQVVFMIANYLMLFLSFIAISAEIHERAPRWIEWVNENVSSVQNCAADHDALFECISNGDFTGLVASIILWATNSVATKQIFLFGFSSTQKLWTVVYESFVTAFCWGTSYLCIRRGLNPDTRNQVLQKYWKDALYGSLAGFNAAFMKAVLKNLLPKADQVLDVLEHRQLRIVNFIGKVFSPHKD